MLTFIALAAQPAARFARGRAWQAGSLDGNAMREEEMPEELTGQEIRQLLAELMSLSGQPAAARPALELLIGDILTRTSVEPAGADLYLCVTGLLPPCAAQVSPAVLASALEADQRPGCELLWHADYGRYILVRKIALRLLTDERSVMDEILNTADLAQRCAQEIGGA